MILCNSPLKYVCSIRGRNLVIQSEQNQYSCYHFSVVRLNQNLSGSRVHGEILEIFYEWMEMVYTTRAHPKWPDPWQTRVSQTWSFLSASGRSLKPFASCTSAPETQKNLQNQNQSSWIAVLIISVVWLMVESPKVGSLSTSKVGDSHCHCDTFATGSPVVDKSSYGRQWCRYHGALRKKKNVEKNIKTIFHKVVPQFVS